METNLESGRKLLVSVIVVAVLVSFLIVILVGAYKPLPMVLLQIGRLGGTLVLCYLLYKKHVWARWVSGLLFAVGGLGALGGWIALLGKSRVAWILLSFSAAYAYCSVLLLFSEDLGAYMRGAQALEQKAAPIEEQGEETPTDNS